LPYRAAALATFGSQLKGAKQWQHFKTILQVVAVAQAVRFRSMTPQEIHSIAMVLAL
jgi:hypothetical protein